MIKKVCAKCGSDKVQSLAWVEINTKKLKDLIDSEYWCPICGGIPTIVDKKDFKNTIKKTTL